MAAGVGVARVDRTRERRGGAEARDAVGAARDPAELGELGDVGAREAHLVLAVLLRPVERAVGEPDQRVALASVLRERGDAGADGDRAGRAELGLRDARDDRLRGRERQLLVHARQQHGELVAAEPERLAALAQPRRDLREDAVAGRMAELVVDALEVVDVEEAQRDDAAVLVRLRELALQALVEVAVVAEPGQRVGEREPDRVQRPVRRALVERDRDERAGERREEVRRALPEHDEHQGASRPSA